MYWVSKAYSGYHGIAFIYNRPRNLKTAKAWDLRVASPPLLPDIVAQRTENSAFSV